MGSDPPRLRLNNTGKAYGGIRDYLKQKHWQIWEWFTASSKTRPSNHNNGRNLRNGENEVNGTRPWHDLHLLAKKITACHKCLAAQLVSCRWMGPTRSGWPEKPGASNWWTELSLETARPWRPTCALPGLTTWKPPTHCNTHGYYC